MERNQQLAGGYDGDRAASTEIPAGPLLSIGLAVYNGQTHLRDSIDSLLAQDVDDLELIISDNASTDATGAICREYADKDPRVHYTRNAENIGAAANFNRAFELSSGRYFMWGSDDDLWDPRFARLCIERLERTPGAVMCTSRVALIDDGGDVVSDVTYEPCDTEGMALDRRIFEMTKQAAWFDTYSVIRPSALRATRLHLPTFGMDVRLQLELLLQGESLVVPQKLRAYRLPQVGKTASEYVTEIAASSADDTQSDQLTASYTYLANELLKVVREARLPEDLVARIENDLAETLTLVNIRWSDLILEESGISDASGMSTAARRSVIRSALGLSAAAPSLFTPRSPWQPVEGMRLAGIRKLLLRLLQPFIERQHLIDTRAAETLERLSFEVDWLNRRVRDLERRTASPSNPARSLLLEEAALNEEALVRDGVLRQRTYERLRVGPDALPAGGIPRGAAWRAGDGMRLQGLRRTVLKLLQPFADDQNEDNGRRADLVEGALLELGMLRCRVQAIEHVRESEREDRILLDCDTRA